MSLANLLTTGEKLNQNITCNNLTCNGTASVDGLINTGNVTIDGNITVNGTASSINDVTISGTLKAETLNFNVANNLSIGGPFTYTGTVTNCILASAAATTPTLGSSNYHNTIFIVADAGATEDAAVIKVATSADLSNGVYMNYSDNAWSMISSKLLKTAVNAKVDHVKNSRLFDALNIDRWVYNTNKKVENYGPYAEDMKELFNVGTGSTLSTQDLDGVLYTVVKGLCQRVNDLEKQHNS